MQPYAIIDETYFPIVRVTFTGNKSTDQNFQVYLNQVRACYRHQRPLFLIFDATHISAPGYSHQKMQAKWLKDNEELIRSLCAGTAYVIPDPSIRAILRVVFLIQSQPVPYQIFEDLAEAEAWVNGLILN
jgi:hypothetical protein